VIDSTTPTADGWCISRTFAHFMKSSSAAFVPA
jgi:hypothetical protein